MAYFYTDFPEYQTNQQSEAWIQNMSRLSEGDVRTLLRTNCLGSGIYKVRIGSHRLFIKEFNNLEINGQDVSVFCPITLLHRGNDLNLIQELQDNPMDALRRIYFKNTQNLIYYKISGTSLRNLLINWLEGQSSPPPSPLPPDLHWWLNDDNLNNLNLTNSRNGDSFIFETIIWVENSTQSVFQNHFSLYYDVAEAIVSAKWDQLSIQEIQNCGNRHIYLANIPREAYTILFEQIQSEQGVEIILYQAFQGQDLFASIQKVLRKCGVVAENTISLEPYHNNIQNTLLPNIERIYPYMAREYSTLLLCDREDYWEPVEKNEKANLVLSSEEREKLRIPIPLFIEGQAGSGKSTVLFYRFADYAYLALRNPEIKLFSLSQAVKIGDIENLRQLFEEHDHFLSQGASIQSTGDAKWAIRDGKRNFSIRQNSNGEIEIYYPNIHPIFISYSSKLLETAQEAVIDLLKCNDSFMTNFPLPDQWEEKINHWFKRFDQFLLEFLPQEERNDHFGKNEAERLRRRVDFTRFKQFFQRSFPQVIDQTELAWYFIRTYIKGYDRDEIIDYDDYQALPRRDKISGTRTEFDQIQSYYCRYKEWLQEEHYWDDQDLAKSVLKYFFKHPLPKYYGGIFCDEAQDFTRVELSFLLELFPFTNYQMPADFRNIRALPIPFAFAGDPLQTLNPTGFRWERLKDTFYHFAGDTEKLTLNQRQNLRDHLRDTSLKNNYRSHPSIVKVANLIQVIRKIFFEKIFSLNTLVPQKGWRQQHGERVNLCIPGENYQNESDGYQKTYRMSLELAFQGDLNNGAITDNIRDTFAGNGLDLSKLTVELDSTPTLDSQQILNLTVSKLAEKGIQLENSQIQDITLGEKWHLTAGDWKFEITKNSQEALLVRVRAIQTLIRNRKWKILDIDKAIIIEVEHQEIKVYLDLTKEMNLFYFLSQHYTIVPYGRANRLDASWFVENLQLQQESGFSFQKTKNIFGVSEVKGLEYSKPIFLHKFGDHFYRKFNRTLYDIVNHRADFLSNMVNLLAISLYFNQLYVALTRAKEEIWIFDTKEGYENFWKYFIQGSNELNDLLTKVQQDQQVKVWEEWKTEIRGIQFGFSKNLPVSDSKTQAQELESQAKATKNPAFFFASAHFWDLAHNSIGYHCCMGWGEYYDENYKKSGRHFEQIEDYSQAFESYWKGNCWKKLVEVWNRFKAPSSDLEFRYWLASFMDDPIPFKWNKTIQFWRHLPDAATKENYLKKYLKGEILDKIVKSMDENIQKFN